jgi:hypothetical protein
MPWDLALILALGLFYGSCGVDVWLGDLYRARYVASQPLDSEPKHPRHSFSWWQVVTKTCETREARAIKIMT